MNEAKSLDVIVALLSVALNVTEQANVHIPGENPMDTHDLADIKHGWGVRKGADHRVAKPMMPEPDDIKPLDMEWFADDPEGATEAYERQWKDQAAYRTDVEGRREGLKEGREETGKNRKRTARARATRRAQIEKIAASPVRPDPERLERAWSVVVPMSGIVEKIAASKEAWASRYLGSVRSEDIPSQTIEKMVLMLAKSDEDLDLLAMAATQLGSETRRKGTLPGHQPTKEEKSEANKMAKARKWLMAVTNTLVMNTLADAYREATALNWENIDTIDTVMATVNGKGEDPLVNRHKADRAPAMLGSKWQRPDGINPDALAMVIAAAITEHHLDPLTELLINEDNLRTDGAFRWAEHAEEVFLACPDGEEKWKIVVRATEGLADPKAARADAARRYTRIVFDWLPSLIVAAVRAFDYENTETVMFVDGQIRSRVRNEIDYYLGGYKTSRNPLRPTLTYATPEEAARAIVENLSVLITGEDLARGITHA